MEFTSSLPFKKINKFTTTKYVLEKVLGLIIGYTRNKEELWRVVYLVLYILNFLKVFLKFQIDCVSSSLSKNVAMKHINK